VLVGSCRLVVVGFASTWWVIREWYSRAVGVCAFQLSDAVCGQCSLDKNGIDSVSTVSICYLKIDPGGAVACPSRWSWNPAAGSADLPV